MISREDLFYHVLTLIHVGVYVSQCCCPGATGRIICGVISCAICEPLIYKTDRGEATAYNDEPVNRGKDSGEYKQRGSKTPVFGPGFGDGHKPPVWCWRYIKTR